MRRLRLLVVVVAVLALLAIGTSPGHASSEWEYPKAQVVVANPASLTSHDRDLQDILEADNYLVSFQDDDAAVNVPSDTNVVVIAPSSDGTALGSKYKLTAFPMVVFASSAWDSMGLSVNDGSMSPSSSLALVDMAHPLTYALSSPTQVTTTAQNMRSMSATNVAPGAVRVATRAEDSAANVIFTIDQGALLVGGTSAPAPRAVVGLSGSALADLTLGGEQVVENAVIWADEYGVPGGGGGAMAAPAGADLADACGTLALRSHWPMNETSGTAMTDVVGGKTGTINGALIGQPAALGFGTSYRFGRGAPLFPTGSQVTVADHPDLDPGECNFAVEVLVKWDQVDPASGRTYNVAQKGLSTAPGNWKIEVDGRPDKGTTAGKLNHFGRVNCIFDGNDGLGKVKVTSRRSERVSNNGTWTKIRCEREGDQFIVRVGTPTGPLGPEKVKTLAGVGKIENANTLNVGAKQLDDVDTFPGHIDDLA